MQPCNSTLSCHASYMVFIRFVWISIVGSWSRLFRQSLEWNHWRTVWTDRPSDSFTSHFKSNPKKPRRMIKDEGPWNVDADGTVLIYWQHRRHGPLPLHFIHDMSDRRWIYFCISGENHEIPKHSLICSLIMTQNNHCPVQCLVFISYHFIGVYSIHWKMVLSVRVAKDDLDAKQIHPHLSFPYCCKHLLMINERYALITSSSAIS